MKTLLITLMNLALVSAIVLSIFTLIFVGYRIGRNKPNWENKEVKDSLMYWKNYYHKFLEANGKLIEIGNSFLYQDFVRKHSQNDTSDVN